MATWLDSLADELGQSTLTQQEIDALLLVARDVAHRVERKSTPLSTFLLGTVVGQAVASGDDREAALTAAIGRLLPLLPPQDAAIEGRTAPEG